jgi:hypothetical protein
MVGRLNCVIKNSPDGTGKLLASASPVFTALVAVLVFSFILIPQKSEGGIYAPNPPPALIPETPGPPPPWRTYAWIPGHWRWHRNRYDWVPGVYAFDKGAPLYHDPRVFRARTDDCGSLFFDEINRTIVTQKSLLQLFFWQVLFLDVGKIYRVIDASTGHQIESLSGSIFGVTLIRVAVRIVRLNRNDIMQRQPTPFIADGVPRELGLVENLSAH